MKKQVSHILFLVLTAVLVTAAGVLAYSGLHQNAANHAKLADQSLSLDEKNMDPVLDTIRFFEQPCYEYCQVSTADSDCEDAVDVISKTIVKVENDKGDFENIEESSIKKFPANKSLNLMVEKYTLKRKMINSNPSFFVTVESFNTRIYQSDILDIDFQSNNSLHTSFTREQYDWMKAFCQQDDAITLPDPAKRPL